RCDWGPQYIADAWISEVKWLGITISPSYVGEPECNGVMERFIRTLKEQCIYLHRFQSIAEAERIIGAFITSYNVRAWGLSATIAGPGRWPALPRLPDQEAPHGIVRRGGDPRARVDA